MEMTSTNSRTAAMAMILWGTSNVWNGTPSRFSTIPRPANMITEAMASERTMCSRASFDSIP